MQEFGACREGLEDPRTGNATLHDLHDLLMSALCSVICGGENAMDMAAFAKAKEPLLRGFLRLPNGVPSHDTFSRLFRLVRCFNLMPETRKGTFLSCANRGYANFALTVEPYHWWV